MKKAAPHAVESKPLHEVFANHARYLRGMIRTFDFLFHERRFTLAWGAVVTGAIIYLAVR